MGKYQILDLAAILTLNDLYYIMSYCESCDKYLKRYFPFRPIFWYQTLIPMFDLSWVLNILGFLSYPYTYHFDHFGAFLTYFGVFKKFANYGPKTKNWLWYPSYSDSAPSNYIKNTGYRLLPQNAWGSFFFWFLTWLMLYIVVCCRTLTYIFVH